MLTDMRRSRRIAAALVSLGIATLLGCNAKQPNGSECLKDSDCEFGRCIQYICFDPNESKLGEPDTGAPPVDAGDDTAPAEDADADAADETSTTDDTGAPDTGAPDTDAPDTGAPDTDSPGDAADDA